MQDDVGKRTNTLQVMHMIYEEAIVITVAASGKNADAGLPGLFPSSRSIEEVTATVDGVGLILSRKFKKMTPRLRG